MIFNFFRCTCTAHTFTLSASNSLVLHFLVVGETGAPEETYINTEHANPMLTSHCQGSPLTALSVLSLFNVSLFVLCVSTWLRLCCGLPCARPVPPPCYLLPRPPLFSPCRVLVCLSVVTCPSCL